MPGPPRARGPMPRARCESPPSTPAGFIRPGPPTLGRPMQATARSRPGHRQGTAALLRLPAAAARGGGGRHAVRGQPSSPAHATRGKPGAQLLVSGTGPAAGPGGCEPRWVRHRNGLHKSGVVCGMSRARPSGRRGWAAPRALNRLRVRRLSPSLSSLSFSLSPSHSLSLSLSFSHSFYLSLSLSLSHTHTCGLPRQKERGRPVAFRIQKGHDNTCAMILDREIEIDPNREIHVVKMALTGCCVRENLL